MLKAVEESQWVFFLHIKLITNNKLPLKKRNYFKHIFPYPLLYYATHLPLLKQ